MKPRVVITGIGIVSGLGAGSRSLRDALRETGPLRLAARVPESVLECVQDSPQARRMARVSLFSLVAAREALREARLDLDPKHPHDDAVVVSASTHLSTEYGLKFHEGFLAPGKPAPGPIFFSNGCLNAVSSHISLEFRLTGGNHTIVGGMNAGLQALGLAARILENGPCRIALCAAAEELTEILAGAYAKFRLAPPMILGEGGAALVLETEEHARSRGATPIAIVHAHHSAHGETVPRDVEGRGIARAIETVVKEGKIDVYSSCANGSELDEREEAAARVVLPRNVLTLAVKRVLGEGFAFTSLAQAVALAEEMRARRLRLGVACSMDRRGDVSSVALRGVE